MGNSEVTVASASPRHDPPETDPSATSLTRSSQCVSPSLLSQNWLVHTPRKRGAELQGLCHPSGHCPVWHARSPPLTHVPRPLWSNCWADPGHPVKWTQDSTFDATAAGHPALRATPRGSTRHSKHRAVSPEAGTVLAEVTTVVLKLEMVLSLHTAHTGVDGSVLGETPSPCPVVEGPPP